MPDPLSLLNSLQAQADPAKAVGMKAYMKDNFEFLGVQSQPRRAIALAHLPKHGAAEEFDWGFVAACWQEPWREMQYVVLDYIGRNANLLTASDLPRLRPLVERKSWWDTVDGLASIIGSIVRRDPALKAEMLRWSVDENLWIRRVAIEHQLHFKNETDTDLLERILVQNFGTREFFINKAIGWALRDYAWTNPAWVADFIARHRSRLSSLSIREGAKHL